MRYGIWIAALVVCLATTARAEGAAAEAPEAEPDWSLGAGIGGSGLIRGRMTEVNLSGPDALDFTAEIGSSPSVFIEHRVGRSLWLLGRATFKYNSSTSGPSTSTSGNNGTTKRQTTSLDGDLNLGLRGVLASMKRVQFSLYGSVGFGLSRLTSGSTSTDGSQSVKPDEVNGYNVGGTFGVVCDAFLMPNIALRLSTPLLGLTYSASKSIEQSPNFNGGLDTVTTPFSGVTGGLVISPSLELRILF